LALEDRLKDPNIWENKEEATSLTKEVSDRKKEIDRMKQVQQEVKGYLELFEIADEEMLEELEESSNVIAKMVEEIKLSLLFRGPFDHNHCFLEVHSGAGGTEACDWALMLYRMYTRWNIKKERKRG